MLQIVGRRRTVAIVHVVVRVVRVHVQGLRVALVRLSVVAVAEERVSLLLQLLGSGIHGRSLRRGLLRALHELAHRLLVPFLPVTLPSQSNLVLRRVDIQAVEVAARLQILQEREEFGIRRFRRRLVRIKILRMMISSHSHVTVDGEQRLRSALR